jgi:hypothetical protein
MSVLLAIGNLRQEDFKFEAKLGYIGSSRPAWLHNETLSQKNKKQKKKTTLMAGVGMG